MYHEDVAVMHREFEFTRNVNGEAKRDVAILVYNKDIDPDRALHRLGLECCLKLNNEGMFQGDMTFATLMECVTPEMLSAHGIKVLWPNETAIPMDNAPPIISRYEVEAYQEARNYEYSQEMKVRKVAEQIARRLETQRMHGHPAISTWAPNLISVKGITWAFQFVYGNETDLSEFFDQKLREAKPHISNKNQTTIDVGAAGDVSKGQYAGQIPQ